MAGQSRDLWRRVGGWFTAAALLTAAASALLLLGPDLLRVPAAEVRLSFPEDVVPQPRFRASPVAPESRRELRGDQPTWRELEHDLSAWENAGGPIPLQYKRIRSRAGL